MLTALASLVIPLAALAASNTVVLEHVRVPAAVGTYYPAQPDTLRSTLDRLFAQANQPLSPTRVVACIAPNGPYGLSGGVAAQAFAGLEQGQYDRVIILSGPHTTQLQGASLPDVQAYVTPLGVVELDPDGVRDLGYSPQVKINAVRHKGGKRSERIHEDEYGIEVMLPFLQQRLGYFRIIPVLIGKFGDTPEGLGSRAADQLADRIRKLMDERTLLVISTNLTHYGRDFNFVPFPENTQAEIKKLDDRLIAYILRQDPQGLLEYLVRNNVQIDGANALYVGLRALAPGLIGQARGYTTSGGKLPLGERSVSYAAITFRHPTDPPPVSRRPPPAPGALVDAPAGTP